MSALNAFVLFSVLSSALIPLRIPTMIARITISPTEDTVNEMLETLFLAKDSKAACSSALKPRIKSKYQNFRTYFLIPCCASPADS